MSGFSTASVNSSRVSDGPPPYRLSGYGRVTEWRTSVPEEWLELEVELWISGLCWNPWQEPSVQSSPPRLGEDEVRRAVVPGARVGVSYTINVKAKLVRLIEVADLP